MSIRSAFVATYFLMGSAFAQENISTLQSDGQTYRVESLHDRFTLFSECAPLSFDLVVDDDLSDARDSFHSAIESRLRAARLYEPTYTDPYLRIAVTTYETAFAVNISLRRELFKLSVGPGIDRDNLFLLMQDEQSGTVSDEQQQAIYEARRRGLIPELGEGVTWSMSSVGIFNDYLIIRSAISEFIDVFLVDYLRVNEDAC